MSHPIDLFRRDLDPALILADPHPPVASVLRGMADRLTAVSNFLATLNDAEPEDRRLGIEVVGMGVDYTGKVLGHLDLNSIGSTPTFLNLKMASLAITNVLALVHGHLIEWQRAAPRQSEGVGGDMEHDAEQPDAVSEIGHTPNAAASSVSEDLVIDRQTFKVSYKGKECTLGHCMAFRLLERLNEGRGTYIHLDTLIQDVWHGKEVGDEAVQRQVSTLRTKLAGAGIDGIVIDGKQRGHYRLILR